MPKRTDLHSILVIGAGPIVIGQACEFDYSGHPGLQGAARGGLPGHPGQLEPGHDHDRPGNGGRRPTSSRSRRPWSRRSSSASGRTRCCRPWAARPRSTRPWRWPRDGTLERLGVELIGASPEAIDKAEDRALFREAMQRIGLDLPKSHVVRTLEEAREALAEIGLPAIIRPSFTLGGTGGGIAYNREEFEQIVASGLDASPIGEVQIDQSVLGWKEYEMEVVRDRADNCIIVCSIENVDPMGVHTGDSITVAPALTLTDKEYQRMRNASIAVLREIGVDTGGSNVQFAIDPATGRMVVIEMNPRVSRCSALASKATGFPIAKVAAKLAVGYTLDEIQNDITGATPASFEPIDRLRRHQDPALHLREVPRDRAAAHHRHEVGRRGHGDGPDLQGIAAEGAARAGDRAVAAWTRSRSRAWPATIGRRRRCWPRWPGRHPDRLRLDRAGLPRRAGPRRDPGAPAPTIPGSWRRSGTSSRPRQRSAARRPAGRRRRPARTQGRRLLRPAPRPSSPGLGEAEVARVGAGAGRASGVQADRHLRRRVRGAHALPLQLLRDRHRRRARRRVREPAQRPAQGDHPGRRAEPDRPGDRVRLLLRACRRSACARPGSRRS